jgi:hypothetical protein
MPPMSVVQTVNKAQYDLNISNMAVFIVQSASLDTKFIPRYNFLKVRPIRNICTLDRHKQNIT